MIPSKLKIGTSLWTIIYSKNLVEDGDLGKQYRDQHELHIAEHQCEDEKEDSFLHEVLHACCRFAGIPNNVKHKLTEEEFIERLTPVLHMVLRDNGFWTHSP